MQVELKEKLEKLSEEFNRDLDVISLKALCNMPESDENTFAITELLNRLIEKYSENEEILKLLPEKEKMSLGELITILEKKYPKNVEIIAIKALLVLPEGEDKEKAIKQHLERFLDQNQEDEDIIEYFENEERIEKQLETSITLGDIGVINLNSTSDKVVELNFKNNGDKIALSADINVSKIAADDPVNGVREIVKETKREIANESAAALEAWFKEGRPEDAPELAPWEISMINFIKRL